MKLPIPSLRDIERITRVVPIIKDLLPDRDNRAESSLLNIIKQQEDALHDKKAEIYTLREKVIDLEKRIWDLEGDLTITSDELRHTRVQLGQAGG
jgi:hypothetical protein